MFPDICPVNHWGRCSTRAYAWRGLCLDTQLQMHQVMHNQGLPATRGMFELVLEQLLINLCRDCWLRYVSLYSYLPADIRSLPSKQLHD